MRINTYYYKTDILMALATIETYRRLHDALSSPPSISTATLRS